MKVKCISQCQKNRKILYKVGKIYEIDKDMYRRNTTFFEEIKEEKNKE